MQVPRVSKITLNMGVGEAKTDAKALDSAIEELTTIAGQRAQMRTRTEVDRELQAPRGHAVGAQVTLRGARMYEFLDRLVSIALPRIRDFRGLNPDSFDGRGNYSLGIREQIIFPEIDYDSVAAIRGLDVAITTTAKTTRRRWRCCAASGSPSRPREGTARWPRSLCASSRVVRSGSRCGEYTRCKRCGRPRAVFRSSGSAASACGSSRTRA